MARLPFTSSKKTWINIYSETSFTPGGNKLLGAIWKLYMDNDPKHKSKLCIDILHVKHIDHIPTPTQSPELNVIEDVRGGGRTYVIRRVYMHREERRKCTRMAATSRSPSALRVRMI